MSQSDIDLGSLFNTALKTVMTNRQQINKLDTEQENHGDRKESQHSCRNYSQQELTVT